MQTTEFPDIETEESDPLAGLGLDLPAELEESRETHNKPTDEYHRELTEQNEAGIARINEWLKTPENGEPLYIDLETIPDFGRMFRFGLEPLPSMPPVDGPDALLPAEQFCSQNVPDIERWLAKHNPPSEWVAEAIAYEKGAKKRKGFFDAIDDHKKRIASIASAEVDRVKMLSVNPLYCGICCIGFAIGKYPPMSLYCGNDILLERAHLEMLWRLMARHNPIIGYGVSFFDIPVIKARSMILGVKPTRMIDNRKYGSIDVVDLCRSLFEDHKSFGLGKVCQALGIDSAMPDVDGSHVYEMWKAGDMNGIRRYCEDDVLLVQRLHREKMAGYFVT